MSRSEEANPQGPWLSIIGIGEEGLEGLSPSARALLDQAEVLVGGARHLEFLPLAPDDKRERLAWPSPLSALVEEIKGRRGQRVCVLASGDPLWYGVAVTLAREIPVSEMFILPHSSAFSLACARMGWPLASVEVVTLHGRPRELLHPLLYPNARLLILSHGRETPGAVAELLRNRGYGESEMTLLEHMGGPKERRKSGRAADWSYDPEDIADLNTIAVACQAAPQAEKLSRVPGLPDWAFRHDGQMTKREVRAATLSALSPYPGALLWDVGAGCGSVAIEWMRSHRDCRAIAIERDATRLAMMSENALSLGVPGLMVVAGSAPQAFDGLARPDALFIGGGITTPGLFDGAWSALRPGGRIVANTVTLEGEAKVIALQAELGGELSRISVSRSQPVGPYRGWKPFMSVTQWSADKPYDKEQGA